MSEVDLATRPHGAITLSQSPTVDFLMRMKYMDQNFVTPRDVMCLYVIITKPGLSRQDLCDAIGLNAISNVFSNINRLMRWGYIEDRRKVVRQSCPSMLHPLPAGIEFWENIRPKG